MRCCFRVEGFHVLLQALGIKKCFWRMVEVVAAPNEVVRPALVPEPLGFRLEKPHVGRAVFKNAYIRSQICNDMFPIKSYIPHVNNGVIAKNISTTIIKMWQSIRRQME